MILERVYDLSGVAQVPRLLRLFPETAKPQPGILAPVIPPRLTPVPPIGRSAL
ncbi:hypothetical protein [Ottowia thiooxydans]|uniref:Uncharacterized protein n=1 Tax=Ottowia thiooxydans TaxID=219182 RepID=A0ABV2Q5Z4_9BURK